MGLMKGNENMASKHVLNCAPFIVCFLRINLKDKGDSLKARRVS